MYILFNIYSFYKNSRLVQQSMYFPSSKDTKPSAGSREVYWLTQRWDQSSLELTQYLLMVDVISLLSPNSCR